MDTTIGYKYNDVFSLLDIEVSKKLEGTYNVEEIISTYRNYFFNKMFLDITAINDYKNLDNLKKLSMNLNMDKVILLLDKEDAISDSKIFLSKLVDMGIYNFTKDSGNLMYLYNNPNLYRDVAYYQDSGFEDDNIEHATKPKTIIGIKNVTDGAGASTLTYLFKRVLSDYYSVIAIEVGKRDLIYFNDKDCISIQENDIKSILSRYSTLDIALIDLGKCKKENICTDIIYLIEPSTIKLNKLVLVNPNVFNELKGKKVVLNKSLLNNNEISEFEVECKTEIFYNIPPINDKKDVSKELLPLFNMMGLIKEIDNTEINEKKSFLDFFKKKV